MITPRQYLVPATAEKTGADTAVLGGGMYPGYEQLWGSAAADPRTGAAMLGREVTEGEADYALWTQRTQHYVLSTTFAEGAARWRCVCHRRCRARGTPAERGSHRRGPADRAPAHSRWRQVPVRGRERGADAPACKTHGLRTAVPRVTCRPGPVFRGAGTP